MNFLDFKADQYRKEFVQATEELALSLQASQDEQARAGTQMLAAMAQSIDIMERVEADQQSTQGEPLQSDDVSQVGEYALTMLDELSVIAANRGLQQTMRVLHRLSLPVALWVARHGGRIAMLDIVVNAIASYANELQHTEQLGQLCDSIGQVVAAVTDDIRRDIEGTNPMRPWRILNLNWGIVATRSHHPQRMEQVFEQLIRNIPADMKSFFQEGMQQMDIIGYPDHVREVMEKYNKQVGNATALH
jgi:hypothetical protein